jgi:hypothetical protein
VGRRRIRRVEKEAEVEVEVTRRRSRRNQHYKDSDDDIEPKALRVSREMKGLGIIPK